ncbi:hypothetical protein F5Y14DRAFT_397595 [Nemania sp. NC0429]|nr:hypothetical protein F5Y14DRAFT_397595 [Nemania sp. NC0429]
MEEKPDVEILIHIGAPSRAVDDTRYRALAAAYIAYEPAESVHFYPHSIQNRSEQDDTRVSASQVSQPQVVDDDGEFSILSLDDRINPIRSPQASFRSVIDNAGSPQIRMHAMPDDTIPHETPTSTTQASWKTPPSTVQDSHPMNNADPSSLASPTRVLENYLQCFESPLIPPKQNKQSSRSASSGRRLFSYADRQSLLGNLVPCTPPMIPCTPRVRNTIELSLNKGDELEHQDRTSPRQQSVAPVADASDDDIIEETRFLHSSQLSAPTRADSEPPLKSRKLELATSPCTMARASSDMGPQPLPDRNPPVTVEFVSSHGFTFESLEIRPPDPLTSELHIKHQDLVTQGLQKLGRDVGLPSRFQPDGRTREIRPYERGYWLLHCSSWEPRLKRNAWALLANYIGTGIAGWGVWCKRDPDFGELRVYCWGLVVAHVYYVLWMASQREVVHTGSVWIDAEEQKVIVMGSRHDSSR